MVFVLRSVSQKVFVLNDITVMSWAEYSSYESTRRLWSAIIQFLFNFRLIISVLNIKTLLRSQSSYLLPAFITIKSVKRSSICFRVKMIYSSDKFSRIQIILKILLVEICLIVVSIVVFVLCVLLSSYVHLFYCVCIAVFHFRCRTAG